MSLNWFANRVILISDVAKRLMCIHRRRLINGYKSIYAYERALICKRICGDKVQILARISWGINSVGRVPALQAGSSSVQVRYAPPGRDVSRVDFHWLLLSDPLAGRAKPAVCTVGRVGLRRRPGKAVTSYRCSQVRILHRTYAIVSQLAVGPPCKRDVADSSPADGSSCRD